LRIRFNFLSNVTSNSFKILSVDYILCSGFQYVAITTKKENNNISSNNNIHSNTTTTATTTITNTTTTTTNNNNNNNNNRMYNWSASSKWYSFF